MYQNLESVSFSELIEHNSDVMITFCPKGCSLAYAFQDQLVLWDLKGNKIQTRFICDFTVDFISWSPDSELICCGMFKQNIIQVWNIAEPSWRCRISEGFLEISSITWTPDSKHLLVVCESNLKITIWSLVSTGFTVIENPKFLKNNFTFSTCCKYMAVVERKDFEDYISIYSCDSWQLLKCFHIEAENVAEIRFSPCDLVIAVISAVTEEYKVLFYSMDGRLISTYSKSNVMFGITSFAWSPKDNYFLIGDYFEKITILDRRRYEEICSFNLPTSIASKKVNFYQIVEKTSNEENGAANYISSKWEIYEAVKDRPVTISTSLDNSKMKSKVLKSGIVNLQFSIDGQHVAVVSGTMSNVVFIFDTRTLSFSDVVVQKLKIRSIVWHPQKSILAICSGCKFLDLWTPTCCIRIISPYENEFIIKNVEWCRNEDCLILGGKDNSSILHLPQFSVVN